MKLTIANEETVARRRCERKVKIDVFGLKTAFRKVESAFLAQKQRFSGPSEPPPRRRLRLSYLAAFLRSALNLLSK